MGLLDDILNAAPNGQDMGLLSYLNSGLPTSPDSKNKKDLADALALNSAPPVTTPNAPLNPIEQQMMTMAGPNQPVSGLGFGQGATAPIFATAPGSTPGNPALPPPAAPVVPPVADAMVQGDDEEDTPTAPNAPAAPIPVGGVNMPRIGPAASFAPAANAMAQAPAPAAPAAAAPVAPANPLNAAGDHLKASWQSMRNGGGLIGGLSALLTGQRDDPVATSQAAQAASANLTGQALLKAGVDPSLVTAALQPGNTEFLHKLFAQALTQGTHTQETDKDGNVWDVNKQTGQRTLSLQPKDDKFQHFVVKNPDGSESVKSFNTKTGEVSDVPQSGASAGTPTVDPNSTGKERMDQLMATNPNYARKVQSAVNGDIPLPVNARNNPQAQRFIDDVLAVDGSTSASDFTTRAATRKDYASGVASRVTKSLNTTIKHAGQLDSDVDNLHNYTYFPHLANAVHDAYSGNTDPEYQKAKSKFEEDKEAFVKELDFTLSGGHSSVSGSAELRDKISRADSPEAMHAAIQSALHLLSARLDSHTRGFNEGTKSQRDGQDFLYPENRAIYNKLLGSTDTSTGQPVPGVESSAPAAPVTGKIGPGAYVWTPDKGLVKQ
jgi:hypothetical protein